MYRGVTYKIPDRLLTSYISLLQLRVINTLAHTYQFPPVHGLVHWTTSLLRVGWTSPRNNERTKTMNLNEHTLFTKMTTSHNSNYSYLAE